MSVQSDPRYQVFFNAARAGVARDAFQTNLGLATQGYQMNQAVNESAARRQFDQQQFDIKQQQRALEEQAKEANRVRDDQLAQDRFSLQAQSAAQLNEWRAEQLRHREATLESEKARAERRAEIEAARLEETKRHNIAGEEDRDAARELGERRLEASAAGQEASLNQRETSSRRNTITRWMTTALQRQDAENRERTRQEDARRKEDARIQAVIEKRQADLVEKRSKIKADHDTLRTKMKAGDEWQKLLIQYGKRPELAGLSGLDKVNKLVDLYVDELQETRFRALEETEREVGELKSTLLQNTALTNQTNPIPARSAEASKQQSEKQAAEKAETELRRSLPGDASGIESALKDIAFQTQKMYHQRLSQTEIDNFIASEVEKLIPGSRGGSTGFGFHPAAQWVRDYSKAMAQSVETPQAPDPEGLNYEARLEAWKAENAAAVKQHVVTQQYVPLMAKLKKQIDDQMPAARQDYGYGAGASTMFTDLVGFITAKGRNWLGESGDDLAQMESELEKMRNDPQGVLKRKVFGEIFQGPVLSLINELSGVAQYDPRKAGELISDFLDLGGLVLKDVGDIALDYQGNEDHRRFGEALRTTGGLFFSPIGVGALGKAALALKRGGKAADVLNTLKLDLLDDIGNFGYDWAVNRRWVLANRAAEANKALRAERLAKINDLTAMMEGTKPHPQAGQIFGTPLAADDPIHLSSKIHDIKTTLFRGVAKLEDIPKLYDRISQLPETHAEAKALLMEELQKQEQLLQRKRIQAEDAAIEARKQKELEEWRTEVEANRPRPGHIEDEIDTRRILDEIEDHLAADELRRAKIGPLTTVAGDANPLSGTNRGILSSRQAQSEAEDLARLVEEEKRAKGLLPAEGTYGGATRQTLPVKTQRMVEDELEAAKAGAKRVGLLKSVADAQPKLTPPAVEPPVLEALQVEKGKPASAGAAANESILPNNPPELPSGAKLTAKELGQALEADPTAPTMNAARDNARKAASDLQNIVDTYRGQPKLFGKAVKDLEKLAETLATYDNTPAINAVEARIDEAARYFSGAKDLRITREMQPRLGAVPPAGAGGEVYAPYYRRLHHVVDSLGKDAALGPTEVSNLLTELNTHINHLKSLKGAKSNPSREKLIEKMEGLFAGLQSKPQAVAKHILDENKVEWVDHAILGFVAKDDYAAVAELEKSMANWGAIYSATGRTSDPLMQALTRTTGEAYGAMQTAPLNQALQELHNALNAVKDASLPDFIARRAMGMARHIEDALQKSAVSGQSRAKQIKHANDVIDAVRELTAKGVFRPEVVTARPGFATGKRAPLGKSHQREIDRFMKQADAFEKSLAEATPNIEENTRTLKNVANRLGHDNASHVATPAGRNTPAELEPVLSKLRTSLDAQLKTWKLTDLFKGSEGILRRWLSRLGYTDDELNKLLKVETPAPKPVEAPKPTTQIGPVKPVEAPAPKPNQPSLEERYAQAVYESQVVNKKFNRKNKSYTVGGVVYDNLEKAQRAAQKQLAALKAEERAQYTAPLDTPLTGGQGELVAAVERASKEDIYKFHRLFPPQPLADIKPRQATHHIKLFGGVWDAKQVEKALFNRYWEFERARMSGAKGLGIATAIGLGGMSTAAAMPVLEDTDENWSAIENFVILAGMVGAGAIAAALWRSKPFKYGRFDPTKQFNIAAPQLRPVTFRPLGKADFAPLPSRVDGALASPSRQVPTLWYDLNPAISAKNADVMRRKELLEDIFSGLSSKDIEAHFNGAYNPGIAAREAAANQLLTAYTGKPVSIKDNFLRHRKEFDKNISVRNSAFMSLKHAIENYHLKPHTAQVESVATQLEQLGLNEKAFELRRWWRHEHGEGINYSRSESLITQGLVATRLAGPRPGLFIKNASEILGLLFSRPIDGPMGLIKATMGAFSKQYRDGLAAIEGRFSDLRTQVQLGHSPGMRETRVGQQYDYVMNRFAMIPLQASTWWGSAAAYEAGLRVARSKGAMGADMHKIAAEVMNKHIFDMSSTDRANAITKSSMARTLMFLQNYKLKAMFDKRDLLRQALWGSENIFTFGEGKGIKGILTRQGDQVENLKDLVPLIGYIGLTYGTYNAALWGMSLDYLNDYNPFLPVQSDGSDMLAESALISPTGVVGDVMSRMVRNVTGPALDTLAQLITRGGLDIYRALDLVASNILIPMDASLSAMFKYAGDDTVTEFDTYGWVGKFVIRIEELIKGRPHRDRAVIHEILTDTDRFIRMMGMMSQEQKLAQKVRAESKQRQENRQRLRQYGLPDPEPTDEEINAILTDETIDALIKMAEQEQSTTNTRMFEQLPFWDRMRMAKQFADSTVR